MAENQDEEQKTVTGLVGRVEPIDVETEMKRACIEYAMSVIVDRALPDVRDGLKPVQRRIVYSLFEQGFTSDHSYRKCATTVGYVMGKYHPHGDAAIYDSLVHLAQDFAMRYTLVDGNGNFGSRDNDPPAAQRYTEAKMTKISEELVADIKKDTVDFRLNYDEHESEPVVLPSRFPNLLVNGSSGIAVGMATEIPPHNLGEVIDGVVATIDNPDITTDELLQYIKGPDFPTAANIIGVQGIREAYKTGRGKIVVRAEAAIENMPNGRQRIVITELPYKVNNAKLVEHIADLYKDKKIDGISELRDEYSKKGIRIVIELKRDVNANVLLNQLYSHTELEQAFNVNMLAVVPGPNGRYEPKLINLKEALQYYIEHQKNVVTRRTKFDLDKSTDRAHILEGTLKAIDNINEVIEIIRSSRLESEAKERLMKRFDFSDRQAQYIIDMRLGRLTGLERDKILEEYNVRLEEIAYFSSVLADEKKLFGVIKDEILAIKEKYADERRTRIQPYEGEIDIDDLINEQNVAITITNAGYAKRTPAETYKAQRRGGKGIMGLTTKEEDFVKHLIITSSHDMLLFVTTKGRVFALKAYEIPDAGRIAKGTPVVNLIQISQDEKIASVIAVRDFTQFKYMIMGTRSGIVKKTEFIEYKNMRKSGLVGIALREGDEIVNACLSNDDQDVLIITHDGSSIRFSQDDVRTVGRDSIGVKGIELKEGDYVVGFDLCKEGDVQFVVTEKGYGKRTAVEQYRTQSRGGKGLIGYRSSEKTGSVAGMLIVKEDEDIMLITKSGVIIRLHASDISLIGRDTVGVRLMRVDGDDNIIVGCAQTIREDETGSDEIEENAEAEAYDEAVGEESEREAPEESVEVSDDTEI